PPTSRASGSHQGQNSNANPPRRSSSTRNTTPTILRPRPQAPQPPPPPRRPDDSLQLSSRSMPTVRDSFWYCSDFMIGAGMVVLQPTTGKVLLLYEPRMDYWFFPKGRKDVGESLEQTALREAYEESGYRVDFLPLFLPTNAPIPPADRARGEQPCAEPFYVNTHAWGPRRRVRPNDVSYPGDKGGEYLTFWYIGQIAHDAVHEGDTGMPDEKEYQSHLLTLDDACARLKGCGMDHFATILCTAYALWQGT
ncbi:NUDIX hydrolase domain-like protein, partial [Fomitopsis betulina]